MEDTNKVCALTVQVNDGTPVVAGALNATLLTAGITILGIPEKTRRARISEKNFAIVLSVRCATELVGNDAEDSPSLIFALSTLKPGDLVKTQFQMAEVEEISRTIKMPSDDEGYCYSGKPAVRVIDGYGNVTICGAPELTGIVAEVQLFGNLSAKSKPQKNCWRELTVMGVSPPTENMKFWAEADVLIGHTVSFEVIDLGSGAYTNPCRVRQKNLHK